MKAAEIALRMETDAVKFYSEAAGKTSHVAGKRMFLSIMEDEKRHIEMISALMKGLEITTETADPIENVKTVFEELKDEMQERIKATTDDTAALEMAMRMEKEGFEFYKKTSAEAEDPRVKALFERLSGEEEKHYMMFANTLSFLNESGHWFMWKEHTIVEGG
jgi:rubrerythrin